MPEPRPLQAIIFDMDGLMVDTEPLSREVWGRVLQEYGEELDDSTYAQMVGRRSDESARIVLARHNLPITAETLLAHKSRLWETRWRQGVPAMPGLKTLLQRVEQHGIPWAVATSSIRQYAEHVLRQLDVWPTNGAIAAGDEVLHSKPAPDIYLLAAARLGVRPQHCLALEDSLPGAQAALAAGMTLAAVPSGTTTRHDFPFTPYVFDSLRDLATHLHTFFNNSPS